MSIVTLTGPRQSGKTTLSQQAFADYTHLSLEDPDNQQYAINDPRGFLADYPGQSIIDHANDAIPIEIKSGKTITDNYFKNINYWCKLNENHGPPAVIYTGDKSQQRQEKSVLRWQDCINYAPLNE